MQPVEKHFVNQTFNLSHVSFWNETKALSNKLAESLLKGMAQFEAMQSGKANAFKRFKFRLLNRNFQPDQFGLIFHIWSRCLCALNEEKSESLSINLDKLLQKRVQFPHEFRATLPDMEEAIILKIINHFRGMGDLFASCELVRKNETGMAKQALERMLHSFYQSGVPKEDLSLIKFRHLFLDIIAKIENLKK